MVGYRITPEALVFWNRRSEVQELMSSISKLKSFIKKLGEENDVLWNGINVGSAMSDLSQVYANVANALPHVVCTQCQGRPQTQRDGKCQLCGGKGLISKFKWDTVVPAEQKAIREKIAAKKGKK